MFHTMLSKLGIGVPHIEMVMYDSEVIRGQTLKGIIHIIGGKSDTIAHHIDTALQTRYLNPRNENQKYQETLRMQRVCQNWKLTAAEVQSIPFEQIIPMATPVSLNLSQVWLKTILDVSFAVQQTEYDPVRIRPDPATGNLLDTVLALGFEHTLESGKCLALTHDQDVPFSQAFLFQAAGPIGQRLGQRVQTLDLLVRANSYDVDIQLEINRQGQPLSGWLPAGVDCTERLLSFRLRHDEVFSKEKLEDLLLNFF